MGRRGGLGKGLHAADTLGDLKSGWMVVRALAQPLTLARLEANLRTCAPAAVRMRSTHESLVVDRSRSAGSRLRQ